MRLSSISDTAFNDNCNIKEGIPIDLQIKLIDHYYAILKDTLIKIKDNYKEAVIETDIDCETRWDDRYIDYLHKIKIEYSEENTERSSSNWNGDNEKLDDIKYEIIYEEVWESEFEKKESYLRYKRTIPITDFQYGYQNKVTEFEIDFNNSSFDYPIRIDKEVADLLLSIPEIKEFMDTYPDKEDNPNYGK